MAVTDPAGRVRAWAGCGWWMPRCFRWCRAPNTNIPVIMTAEKIARRDAGGGVRAGLRRALNCDTCAMQPGAAGHGRLISGEIAMVSRRFFCGCWRGALPSPRRPPMRR